MTARDFFKSVYGETKMGTPVMKFAEEYHKEKVRLMKVEKHIKRKSGRGNKLTHTDDGE